MKYSRRELQEAFFRDELSFVISQLNVIKYALISGLEFTPFVPLNVESHF